MAPMCVAPKLTAGGPLSSLAPSPPSRATASEAPRQRGDRTASRPSKRSTRQQRVGTADQDLRLRVAPTQRLPAARPPGRRAAHTPVLCSGGGEGPSAPDGASGPQPEVVIVGAGVAGLASALALHRVGIKSVVLERADGLREGGAALSLWANAWRALDALGVGPKLRDQYVALESVEICSKQGRLLRQFDFAECAHGPHEVRGTLRSTLLAALAAELPPGTIRFGTAVSGVEQPDGHPGGGLVVRLQGGGAIPCKVVVGCDGGRSAIASSLDLAPPGYAGYAAYRGVAVLPDGHDLGQSIRMVWGNGTRAGMYPLTANLVYWFTAFNAPPGIRMLDGEARRAEALSHVSGWEYGVDHLIRHTPADDISRSSISDRLTHDSSKLARGGITLAGDAAHPMTPNLGQGACTALEDAVILARKLSEALERGGGAGEGPALGGGRQVAAALRSYQDERVKRCWPLAAKSRRMGVLLQLPYWPVCFVRDNLAVPIIVQPSHFMNHTLYDCGTLPVAAPALSLV